MDCMSIIILVLVCLAIVSFIARSNQIQIQAQAQADHQARLRAIDLAAIDSMDGLSFEHYVAELLRHEGYAEVAVSRASGDFGVDIVASRDGKKYAIQVKRYTGTVSRRAISDAVAGMSHYGCNAAMVITNSYLSKPAMEFATSVGCTLVNRDQLGEWIMRYQGVSSLSSSLPSPLQVEALQNQSHPSVPVREAKNNEHNPARLSVPTEHVSLPKQVHRPTPPDLRIPSQSTVERMALVADVLAIVDALIRAQPSTSLIDQSVSLDDEDAVPSEVVREIKSQASRNWPGDYSMQAYEVEQQTSAYLDLRSIGGLTIPSQVRDIVMKSTRKEWQGDYAQQLYVVGQQFNDYEELLKFASSAVPAHALEEIKRNAYREWPRDYSMQMYIVTSQVKAYRSLHP